jgi:hypothetical protein
LWRQHETIDFHSAAFSVYRLNGGGFGCVFPRHLRSCPAGRKVRVVLKEKDITHQIRSVLKTFGIFHYKNHGGLGSAPGLPDITGCLKDGRGFWIEVKTDKGRLSPHQERFIANINDAGGLAFVARSVDDVIEKLDLKKRMLF